MLKNNNRWYRRSFLWCPNSCGKSLKVVKSSVRLAGNTSSKTLWRCDKCGYEFEGTRKEIKQLLAEDNSRC